MSALMKVAKATALYANKNPAIIYNITRNRKYYYYNAYF